MSKHFPSPFPGNNNLVRAGLAISRQANIAPDFLGSLCLTARPRKGSGLLPQTGSPENQGLFVSTGKCRESVGGLLAWNPCRFVRAKRTFPYIAFPMLAGASFPISSPAQPFLTRAKRVFLAVDLLALVSYFQNMNQGVGLCSACAGARASAVCSNSVCRRSICSSFVASWAIRASTTSVSPGASAGGTGGASATPTSTLQMPSCLMLGRAPALIRLRTVSADTPKCNAASLIVKSMVSTVGHRLVRSALVAYADCRQFGGVHHG
jgi:hypothetical protein